MQIKDTLGIRDKTLESRENSSRVRGASSTTAGGSGSDVSSANDDKVAFSGRSLEMAKAHEAVSSTPDVRRQKVEEIKRQIANNEYEVDAQKVAHRMIVDFLGELV